MHQSIQSFIEQILNLFINSLLPQKQQFIFIVAFFQIVSQILFYNYKDKQNPAMTDQQEQPSKLATGRWTKQEHERFMYAIMQHGKDWKQVQQYVRTRSGSQVRSHAQKFFNKLQKPTNKDHEPNRNAQQFSETEFDIEREMNNEITPCTPMQLVSLIKRQSKQEGKINLSQFKKTLQQKQEQRQDKNINDLEQLGKLTSFKSMSNILSAYEEVNQESKMQEEESFFISITKKYKKLFKQIQDFDQLIDIHEINALAQKEIVKDRKRSFTLPEGSQLEGEELEEKISEIKMKIKRESTEDDKKQTKVQVKEKKERKNSDVAQISIPPLSKLSTIQEQPKEEELNDNNLA